MIFEMFPELEKLTPEQKLLLANELWEQVVTSIDDERDEAILALLNRRFAEFEAHPETGGRWENLRDRFLSPRKP